MTMINKIKVLKEKVDHMKEQIGYFSKEMETLRTQGNHRNKKYSKNMKNAFQRLASRFS